MSAPRFPVDASDETLLSHVRPPDWRNPPPRDRYHLVVVGAGTGGLVTAAIAAGLGARVALVERHLMGGDCLNVGCVPSKALLHSAREYSARGREARDAGADGAFADAMTRLRRLRARIAPVDGAPRFRDELGVDVFLGDGRFTGPGTVAVGDAVLRFRRAVIATGARAALPDVPGLADAAPRTNETIFDLVARPARLVVLGGGAVGCELAQAFARFGSRVTLLEQGARLLPQDDADAAAVVRGALERDGVVVHTGAAAQRVTRDGALRRVHFTAAGGDSGELVAEGDELLVATGRAPNVEGLGLDAAGVRATARGVETDERLRTTSPRIYAVGDVTGRWRFTHAADAMARLVVANALFFGRGRVSSLTVPWCTYTSPEVAQVGLTAEAAIAAGVAVDTFTVPFTHVDRAVLEGATEGFCRVLVRRGTDRLAGVTVVGPHAGEVIGEATLALGRGLGLGALGATIHPYPTEAEALRKAADAWRRTRLTPAARRALGGLLRLFR